MSLIGIRFARALQSGRKDAAASLTRERVLVSLLNKRAVAAQMGADDMEAMLRAQIRWSLPMIDWGNVHSGSDLPDERCKGELVD